MMRCHRRRFNAIGYLTMFSFVSLLGLGLGYAAWTTTLTIDSTARTAAISVRWLTNAETAPLSNAAVCTEIADSQGIGGIEASRDESSLTLTNVTLVNVYPGYEAVCMLRWRNDGDVWIKSTGHQVSGEDAYSGVYLNLDEGSSHDTGDDVFIQFSNGASPTAPGSGGTDQLTVLVLATATPGATFQFAGTHTFEMANP